MYKGNCPCHWKIRMSSPTMAEHRQSQTVREIKASNKMDGWEASISERGGSEHGPCLHQPCRQCPCAWVLSRLQRGCRKQVYAQGRRDCQSAGGQGKDRWEGLEVMGGGLGICCITSQPAQSQGTQASGPPARVEGPSSLPVPCASQALRAVTSVASNSSQPHGLQPTRFLSVHRILQARILEWAAMPFSGVSCQPRNQTHISYDSHVGRWVLYH